MNRLAMDIWICETNIERFKIIEKEGPDQTRRALSTELRGQEENKLRDLMSEQQRRNRLLRLIDERAARGVIENLLDDAISIVEAGAGDIQVFDPAHNHLRLIASRGFSKPFLKFFAVVQCGQNSACSQAMDNDATILVEDVEESSLYAGTASGRVMREAGSAAVLSVPLREQNRHLLGVLSMHWSAVGRPRPDQRIKLDSRIAQALDDLTSI